MTRSLYLHGFASAPTSRKATFFDCELAKNNVKLEIPDLAGGDFRGLTISKQLQIVERAANGERVLLIGSSLGGYIAALYAERHPEVAALVLLAPAFNFFKQWTEELGPAKMEEWRQAGETLVYHYGEQKTMPLAFEFIADASRFDPYPSFTQPCMIFHGTSDPVVPVEYSEAFARNRSNVELVKVQSGHELTDVLEIIWAEAGPWIFRAIR
ncbi:MAG TPA: YqiA/YcfP family alpha/beta fold hydrolase [Bryobacteraceae bacterium]|nr:YqiA/YcfP family alpha/beta fold hydrolase [Bryobacteraceae bacterium]